MKIFKNEKRGQKQFAQSDFIPNYQSRGLTPKIQPIKTVLPNTEVAIEVPTDNPRAAFMPPVNPTFDIPVVGASSWAGFPSEEEAMQYLGVEDDVDWDQSMIDNNNYVSIETATSVPTTAFEKEVSEPAIEKSTTPEFYLFVKEEMWAVGSKNEIEAEVQKLLLGEDVDVGAIDFEDLCVMRRVDIKTGIFLSE